MTPTFLEIPLVELTQPRHGYTMVANRWWATQNGNPVPCCHADRDSMLEWAAARGNMHAGDSGMNSAKVRKNNHPTVKPTDLMAYLCRLVTPPGGVVLDPFMGSGSTGKAAARDGFAFLGVERDAAYFDIATTRVAAAVQAGV